MNEIVINSLLAGDIFLPEMDLRPGIIYSAGWLFTKNKERIQNFK